MVEDRRNYARRGEVIRRIVDSVVQNPGARFTFPRFLAMLGIPEEAGKAKRKFGLRQAESYVHRQPAPFIIGQSETPPT